jgi:hypothetical protein
LTEVQFKTVTEQRVSFCALQGAKAIRLAKNESFGASKKGKE